MGRPIYPHELEDPDFAWLISTFRESNPNCSPVENTCLPIVFLKEEASPSEPNLLLPLPIPGKEARFTRDGK